MIIFRKIIYMYQDWDYLFASISLTKLKMGKRESYVFCSPSA